jgi:hypothetical protein
LTHHQRAINIGTLFRENLVSAIAKPRIVSNVKA